MKKAVVLLSGGIDSSVTMAVAKNLGYNCYALSFDYGQRHKVELEAAKKIAKHIGVKEHLIISFDMRKIGGSALTSDIEVPEGIKEGIPITYVPARNTIFLSFALAWAEVLEASHIFIGANIMDYSGYPDCRPEYLHAFENMANLATKIATEGKIKFVIEAPLLYLTKAEIIKKGVELGLDFSLTWSCYDPKGKPPKPCLKCSSCLIRAKGFNEAGVTDPLLR
ncbi:MAG: 7-cyano-7-deazaguanine synthase QueC [Thermodesulfovibrionaceae bacterium]